MACLLLGVGEGVKKMGWGNGLTVEQGYGGCPIMPLEAQAAGMTVGGIQTVPPNCESQG